MNKILICLSLAVASFAFTSCSDWTEDKSVDIIEPVSPGYEKYLENLKAYKKSDHKYVYATFDNSVKEPFSRGQHVSDIPDSVDVVSMMYPADLADFEIADIKTLKADKGTKVIYKVSFDGIQSDYTQMVKDETDKNEEYVAPLFATYLTEKVGNLLALSSTYDYDGIVIGYNGLSTVYMSEEDKANYLADQEAFFKLIKEWYNVNNTKMIVFEGYPQFLADKSLLESCKHIILNTANVAYAGQLSVNVAEAMVTGVPTDRFIVAANATSLDTADKNIGYYGTDLAIVQAAYWVTESVSGYTKAGLSINNIQNTYYNIFQPYQYAYQSINIMNPAPTN